MKPRQGDVSIPLQTPGPEQQPRDYVLWSLLNVLLAQTIAYLGCCLLPPLIFSIKARDCKVLGDLEGAQSYGACAKRWNIACSILLVVSAGLIISSFIVILSNR